MVFAVLYHANSHPSPKHPSTPYSQTPLYKTTFGLNGWRSSWRNFTVSANVILAAKIKYQKIKIYIHKHEINIFYHSIKVKVVTYFDRCIIL
jgi:hypothetical protein